MKSTLARTQVFIAILIAWIVFGAIVISFTDKEPLHLYLNNFNHPYFDVFFKYGTHLGDGIFAAIIVALGFIYRIRFGVIGLIGLVSSSVITQFLKRQVFDDHLRPSKVFEQMADVHFIDGVNLHTNFSFPSGHSTAAFSTFFFLALIARKPILQVILFSIGLLVAFSRVYISQHFFEDIYVGSIIGASFTFLASVFIIDKTWGEKGFVELFDSKK